MSGTLLTLYYPPGNPGDCFREAIPCGNGETGALVCGYIKNEKILINHARLWHGGETMPLPDVSYTLPQVRRLIDQGDMRQANSLLCDELKRIGYRGDLSVPHPMIELGADFHPDAPFREYQRQLNMETGEVTVSYKYGTCHVQRRLFVSRTDGVVVWNIHANEPLNWEAWLQMPKAESPDGEQAREHILKTSKFFSFSDTNNLVFQAENDKNITFGCVLGVASFDGEEVYIENNRLCFRNVSSATLILRPVVTEGSIDSELLQAKSWVREQSGGYETYLERHAAEHRRLFCSAGLKLGEESGDSCNEQLLLNAYRGELSPELFNKLWNFGRYLLISATRNGGLPCPIYGLWHTGYRQYWTQNMANVNLQMIYWQALVCPAWRFGCCGWKSASAYPFLYAAEYDDHPQ